MHIGFIGLGLMGRPMAEHLHAAGHQLHLWARRPATLEIWQQRSAVQCHGSASEVAAHSEACITMLADSHDVEEVILGAQGLVQGGRAGQVFIDMSTISPSVARQIAAQLEGLGMDFIDAPVSGGPVGAQAASLSIMAGGSAAVFERIEPLLRLMGRHVLHMGASGAGQVAKACNQIITGVTITAVAEALNFAQASGVDAGRVREVLLGGFAHSRILEHHGARMLARDFEPGFKAWMQHKDLRIVNEEVQRLGLVSPAAALAGQLYTALVGSGQGEQDSIALLQLLETLSGTAAGRT